MEKKLRDQLPPEGFGKITAQRSKQMASVKGRGNRSTEVRLRMGLIAARLRGWKMHPKDILGRPDFYFPKERIAIFVDGCFWHGCPACGHIPKKNAGFWLTKIERNRQRDTQQSSALRASGTAVLRFWEHELKSELGSCLEVVRIATRANPTDRLVIEKLD